MITTIGLVSGEEIETEKWSREDTARNDWGEGLKRNSALRVQDQPMLLEVREKGAKRQLILIAPHAIAWMRFG